MMGKQWFGEVPESVE